MASDQERPSDRRDFVKGAVGTTLVGAAAVLGAARTASAQVPISVGESLKLKAVDGVLPRAAKSQVALTFDRESTKLSLNDLQIELQRVFDKFGCPYCGLVGYDLQVAVNPVIELGQSQLKGSIIVHGQ